MIIRLPSKFYYATNDPYAFACVRNGKLYIREYVGFESLMYSLTYSCKDYSKCGYCGQTLTTANCTLDHMYPRTLGGVSLPNNLLPCCRNCNNEKGGLTEKQYRELRTYHLPEERKHYAINANMQNRRMMESGQFAMPSKWLELYNIEKLIRVLNFEELVPERCKKHEDYYQQYNAFMHPIVVSSNGWLLKGLHVVKCAKENGVIEVPAIILENVVVLNMEESL